MSEQNCCSRKRRGQASSYTLQRRSKCSPAVACAVKGGNTLLRPAIRRLRVWLRERSPCVRGGKAHRTQLAAVCIMHACMRCAEVPGINRSKRRSEANKQKNAKKQSKKSKHRREKSPRRGNFNSLWRTH